MRGKFRIGLAGVGPHMKEHLLPSLRLIPGTELVSAVSSSPAKREALQQELWIPTWFEDLAALASSNTCDGIVASGSVDYHEKALGICIDQKIPIFIEKPPTASLAVLRKLAGSALGASVVVGVGLNLPYADVISQIDQYTFQSRNPITRIKIDYHTNKPRKPLWNLASLLDSFLLAIMLHPLSLAHHFLGQDIQLDSYDIHHNDDQIQINARLHAGWRIAELKCSNMLDKHYCMLHIDLAGGERLISYGLDSLVQCAGGRKEMIWSPGLLGLPLNSNGYLKEMQNFVRKACSSAPDHALIDIIPIYKIIDKISARI